MSDARVLPFSAHPLIDTSDLDKARAAATQLFGPVTWDRAPGRRGFHCRMNSATIGPIRLVAGWFAEGLSVGASSDRYNVVLALADGAADAVHRGQRVPITPDRSGLFVTPGEHLDILGPVNTGAFVVTVEREALEAHFARLTRARPAQLQFAPRVDVAGETGAGLMRAIQFIAGELERPASLFASPILRANAQELLLSALLTCASHEQHHQLAPSMPPVSPAYVRRAEAYITERAADAITVTDVAATLGISVRALQAGFQRYRGISPRQFLQERRLDLARQHLLRPAPAATVALIAASTGIAHVGRFSAAYRRRFGEAPKETLRRGRGD